MNGEICFRSVRFGGRGIFGHDLRRTESEKSRPRTWVGHLLMSIPDTGFGRPCPANPLNAAAVKLRMLFGDAAVNSSYQRGHSSSTMIDASLLFAYSTCKSTTSIAVSPQWLMTDGGKEMLESTDQPLLAQSQFGYAVAFQYQLW